MCPGKGQLDSVSMVALTWGQSVIRQLPSRVFLSSEYSQLSRQIGEGPFPVGLQQRRDLLANVADKVRARLAVKVDPRTHNSVIRDLSSALHAALS